MLVTQSAQAAVITRNDDGNILISGTSKAEYAGNEVQIQILGPFDKNTDFDNTLY